MLCFANPTQDPDEPDAPPQDLLQPEPFPEEPVSAREEPDVGVLDEPQLVMPVPAYARGTADGLFRVNNGVIAFHNSTHRFDARCGNASHGSLCRLTRSANASKKGNNPGQGRPLGFLAAWLLHSDAASREDHASATGFITFDERKAERAKFQCHTGRLLLQFERPQEPDEDSEPEII